MIRLRNLLFEFDLKAPRELEKAKNIVKGLQARGFSYTGAVALAGNISHESGCDPDTTESGGTGAYGLMQWDPGYGRRQALEAFAKYVGQSKSNLNTQLDFMKCELINGYQWKGKPVPGIDKRLVYFKQEDGSFKGLSKEYVRKYDQSIVDGDIATSAAKLMDNVFKPIPGSKPQRVANAIKIDQYIKGKSTQIEPATTTASTKFVNSDFKVFPNPARAGQEITVQVNRDKLPIDSIDLQILKQTGAMVPDSKHHWDNVAQGILKFNAPDQPGTYMIAISKGAALKLVVVD